MERFDPLAQRHGELVAEAWRVIWQVSRASSPYWAARHLGKLESLERRVEAARNVELYLEDFDKDVICQWFDRVSRPLSQAVEKVAGRHRRAVA